MVQNNNIHIDYSGYSISNQVFGEYHRLISLCYNLPYFKIMSIAHNILKSCLEKLKEMTPEEVQRISKERGIIIPNEPKNVTYPNKLIEEIFNKL